MGHSQIHIAPCLGNVQTEAPGLRVKACNGTMSTLPPLPVVALSTRSAAKVMSKLRSSSQYLGLVTWTTTETWVEDGCECAESMPDRRGKITLRLPFTSVKVNFDYTQCMGAPSYALNITHVIDESSELGQQIANIRWLGNSLPVWQRLFSDRKLSIYSVYRGQSLFCVSVAAGRIPGPSVSTCLRTQYTDSL